MMKETTKQGEQLKKAREAKGYTQESFAEALNISGRMYQRYEEGRFPKYKSDNIKKIDALLGTNLYDTIYDTNVPRGASNHAVGSEMAALSGRHNITIQDYVNKMEEHNRFLQKIIEAGLVDIKQALTSNFASLHEGQDSAIVYQRAWIEKFARNEGGSDPMKVQAVRDEMDTIIAETRRGHQNENNTGENT